MKTTGDDHDDDSNSWQGNGDKNTKKSKYNEGGMTNVSYESNDKTSHENNDENEQIIMTGMTRQATKTRTEQLTRAMRTRWKRLQKHREQ